MKRWFAKFLEEFVVIFGYLIGLFIALGFSPEPVPPGILKESQAYVATFVPDPLIRFGLALVLLLLLFLAAKKAFITAGPAGMFAIAMGLLAGLATPVVPEVGLGMLALALFTGYIAVWGWRVR
ncbi:MAG: hypothetical protein LUO96_03480 [Methanomicrobiales archaeon]|nr:hypothetical protein [Methanomicrobiales archaeon]